MAAALLEFREQGQESYKRRAKVTSKMPAPKNNERPETLTSPGRPGSPPPELLTDEVIRVTAFCLWHFRAIGPR